MKLYPAPFASIKSGKKKIEMRLYDEKRRKIYVGDTIDFICAATGETYTCKVVQLHCYANFEELYACHDKCLLGYKEGEKASPLDMLAYYAEEEIARYGVVGIEIE